MAGPSTVDGIIKVKKIVKGDSASFTTLAGKPLWNLSLIGTTAASTALTGLMVAIRTIKASFAAASSVTGAFKNIIPIAASLAVSSVLSGVSYVKKIIVGGLDDFIRLMEGSFGIVAVFAAELSRGSLRNITGSFESVTEISGYIFTDVPVGEYYKWYVDNEAFGNNTGMSWDDAWESLGDIDWKLIGPNDVIFISGGESGKTYEELLDMALSGASGGPFNIKVGETEGHTGNVTIDASGIATSGNSWYVDNEASGANDGSSWSDAWESFADINWSSLSDGDTIYISGGSVSKTYEELLVIGGVSTIHKHIIIRGGQDDGHTGEVHFETN